MIEKNYENDSYINKLNYYFNNKKSNDSPEILINNKSSSISITMKLLNEKLTNNFRPLRTYNV